jgi:glycosidase
MLFIGEVYDRNNYRRFIKDLCFDLLYDKSGFYDHVRAIICNGASARNLTRNWQSLQDLQPNMLNFLENHDEQRFASPYFAGDARKAFPALTAGALFNGASFMIYAGQEVGTDASEGTEGRTSIFNWTSPEQLKHLHRFVRSGKGLGAGEADILAEYRRLLSFLDLPQFRDGEVYDLCWCNSILYGFDPEKHFAFLRYKRLPRKRKADATLVVCNFSSEPVDMKINLPEDLRCKKELSWLPQRTGVQFATPYAAYTIPLTSTQ